MEPHRGRIEYMIKVGFLSFLFDDGRRFAKPFSVTSQLTTCAQAKSQFKSRSSANGVEIRIPVPPDVDSPSFKVSLSLRQTNPDAFLTQSLAKDVLMQSSKHYISFCYWNELMSGLTPCRLVLDR